MWDKSVNVSRVMIGNKTDGQTIDYNFYKHKHFWFCTEQIMFSSKGQMFLRTKEVFFKSRWFLGQMIFSSEGQMIFRTIDDVFF